MKKLWMALMVAVLGVAMVVSNAEAKRMGGGGSFGKSSPTFSRQATPQGPAQAAPAQRQAQPAAPAASSPWKGILGGALLGLGLGALLSHLGIGGELAGMIGTLLMVLLVVAAGMFLFRMLARRTGNAQPRPAYAGPMERSMTPDSGRTPDIGANLGGASAASAAPAAQPTTWQPAMQAAPEGFDVNGFLRHAKSNFIRMQAAWDRADVNDIREFTTPKMYAELKMQLGERGASTNHTDVVSIEADLLGVETNSIEHVASVRFHGMIRESDNAPAEAFNEIWVLTKPVAGNQGWLLAGLQQA
ncbi:MAG: Tim44-like domain-containing protein [Burkholderiaceae bacterium]|nr:Tim44-like domain-containing protein [Burkholderiaceae bacterium]